MLYFRKEGSCESLATIVLLATKFMIPFSYPKKHVKEFSKQREIIIVLLFLGILFSFDLAKARLTHL